MHFLLVNTNSAVSRLIVLSVKKLGFKIDEVTSLKKIPRDSYDTIFIDRELYNRSKVNKMRAAKIANFFIYISQRGEVKPKNMDSILEKPFLPTDFIDLIKKMQSSKSAKTPNLDDKETPIDNALKTHNEKEEFIDSSLDDVELNTESDMYADDTNIEDLELDDDILEESDNENSLSELVESEKSLEPILDSEDVDEVKQLLEEDEEEYLKLDTQNDKLEDIEDEELNTQNDKLEDIEDEELNTQNDKLEDIEDEDLDENIEKENIIEDDFDLDELEDLKDLTEDEEVEEVDLVEVKKDILIVNKQNQEISNKEEVEFIEQNSNTNTKISSIEQIDEDDLMGALQINTTPNKNQKINIKEEIQEKVTKSIKESLENSSIKEALKGMKVNFSIEFEEDK
ncbi:MAG: hypothetical protein JJV95_04295 [Sulfurospirillum sp.]|nr:hypothetical protein [Sulfurospirillum sp.]